MYLKKEKFLEIQVLEIVHLTQMIWGRDKIRDIKMLIIMKIGITIATTLKLMDLIGDRVQKRNQL